MVDELDLAAGPKEQLKQTLMKFPELFAGGLGRLKNVKPARITLKKGSKPHRGRYYNMPKSYLEYAKQEVERMVEIGILKKLTWDKDSPWAAPSFGVPKKTGDIRIVTDFRKLNVCIK